MNKINYQLETDRIINSMQAEGVRERLLLHACCAACASYTLEYLSRYFDITLFFCNPNITDRAEYKKRLGELYKLCERAEFCKGIKIVEDTLSSQAYLDYVRGLEKEPEGAGRCVKCFELRLERTAQYAAEHGFDRFATTLTISPHKNHLLINTISEKMSEKYGIKHLPSDFKKRGGYQRSIVLSNQYEIYRQTYCGCDFSRNDN